MENGATISKINPGASRSIVEKLQFGPVLRMNPDTPAWKAFTEALADHEKVGRQSHTWLKKIKVLKPVMMSNCKLKR